MRRRIVCPSYSSVLQGAVARDLYRRLAACMVGLMDIIGMVEFHVIIILRDMNGELSCGVQVAGVPELVPELLGALATLGTLGTE